MKKVFFLASIFIFATILTTFAKQITPEQSRSVAEEVASSSPSLRNNAPEELQLIQTVYDESADLRSETVLYYVYKITEDKGFVIVSGDDCFYPVIGYSLENSYETDNVPPNFRLWMEDVESSISKAIKENKQATERTAKAWDAYLNGNSDSLRSSKIVDALIRTKWDQNRPFNRNCVFSGTTTSAGCIAAAMAQVMNYYKYPDVGICAIPGFTTKTQKYMVPGIPVSEMTYNWSILRIIYSIDATDAPLEEVAKLIFHCAASVETDFDANSSGANVKDVANALITYFGYDKGMHYKKRQYYSDDEWKAILKSELDQLRPMIYTGQKNDGSGHGFICDGYDDEDSFHFNFGWTGVFDGFYTIDGIDFPYYNDVIIGIQKDMGGTLPYEIVIGPNQGPNIYPNISSSTKEITKNESFTVNGSFWNIGYGTFTGAVGYVLLNTDCTFVENIGSSTQTLVPTGLTGIKTIVCNVSGNVPEGNYIIKPAILPSDSSTWQIVNAENGSIGELPLLVKKKNATIPVAGISLNEAAKTLSIGGEFQLTATITPANATNTNVNWTSSNGSVATVNKTGFVKVIAEGTATITATAEDGSKTAICKITVNSPVTNIQTHPSSTIMVYLQDSDQIYINTPFAETISIYTIIGSRIHLSDKPAGEYIINTGGVSKTLWIVKGSSGWIRKIIIK